MPYDPSPPSATAGSAVLHTTGGQRLEGNLDAYIERLFEIEAACIAGLPPERINEITPLYDPAKSKADNVSKVRAMLADPAVRFVVHLDAAQETIIGFAAVMRPGDLPSLAAEVTHRKWGHPGFASVDFPHAEAAGGHAYALLYKLRVHPAHRGKSALGPSAADALHRARCEIAARARDAGGLGADWIATDVTQTNIASLVVQLKAGLVVIGADVVNLDTVDASGRYHPDPCLTLARPVAHRLQPAAHAEALAEVTLKDMETSQGGWPALAQTIRTLRARGSDVVGFPVWKDGIVGGKVDGVCFYDRMNVQLVEENGGVVQMAWAGVPLPPSPPAGTFIPPNPWRPACQQ